MAGLPVMSGAVHDTSSLVLGSSAFPETVGPAGAAGGSFTSVTLIVTAMVSSIVVSAVPPAFLPSVTFTVTLYELSSS